MRPFENKEFLRISKADAKKFYELGARVFFAPSNLTPGGFYGVGSWVCLYNEYTGREFRIFETVVNAFEYYNCTSSETGKYTAFYITPGNKSLHFEFMDGSNPYFYPNKGYKDILKELSRWSKNYKLELVKEENNIYYFNLWED